MIGKDVRFRIQDTDYCVLLRSLLLHYIAGFQVSQVHLVTVRGHRDRGTQWVRLPVALLGTASDSQEFKLYQAAATFAVRRRRLQCIRNNNIHSTFRVRCI